MSRTRPVSRALAAAALLSAGPLLAACGDSGGSPAALHAGAAYIPRPADAEMAAGFLTLTNEGGTADRLTKVGSPAAKSITLHHTEGGTMRQVDSLEIPAHGELKLSTGGDHLMLEGLDHRPKEGEKLRLELHFADSDPLTVEVPVKSAVYRPSA